MQLLNQRVLVQAQQEVAIHVVVLEDLELLREAPGLQPLAHVHYVPL